LTTPLVEGILTQPYVGVAEFRAAPTWLDTDDLIPGGVQAKQDAELANVLLRASSWADNFCELRLGAHTVTEQTRARPDKDGLLYLTPANVPVRTVTALAYGTDFQNLTLLPNMTQTWVEDARGIIVSMFPFNASYFGTLQFGSTPRVDSEVFIQYQYVAGFANTTLTQTANSGTSSLTVADSTGFVAPASTLVGQLNGSVARIWDPSLEEAVSVASTYAGGNVLPLQSPLTNTHAAGVVVSELPAEIRQAIICHAVALMLREDVSEEAPFPSTPFGPSARRSESGGKAGGLIDHAMLLLEPYRRVR
jgi:hypothetical protein